MLTAFDHIRKVCEGQRIVRIERPFFNEIGLPNHNEVHVELTNGVTLVLSSTGVSVMNVPIAEVDHIPGLKLGGPGCGIEPENPLKILDGRATSSSGKAVW